MSITKRAVNLALIASGFGLILTGLHAVDEFGVATGLCFIFGMVLIFTGSMDMMGENEHE